MSKWEDHVIRHRVEQDLRAALRASMTTNGERPRKTWRRLASNPKTDPRMVKKLERAEKA